MQSPLKAPENFNKAIIFASDFDGTIAATFEPSPHNIDVTSAYRHGIAVVLGKQALETYINMGEHRHRAPSEIVASLDPTLKGQGLLEATNALVREKLELLMEEVGLGTCGRKWPRPMSGFLSTWNWIQDQRDCGAFLDTAIISSGHTAFIKKVFEEAWDIPMPDFMVTDDTLREGSFDSPLQDLVKPSPCTLHLVEEEWATSYGLSKMPKLPNRRDKILYAGDDVQKDGGLAERAEIGFVHIEQSPSPVIGWVQVRKELGQRLLHISDTQHANQ